MTRRLLAVSVLALLAGGCGKKGPPLAPYVHIPGAVERATARRVGTDVYVTVTVPARNVDASVPVDIDRIEVYAFTGAAPPNPRRLVEAGTRVATIAIPPGAVPAPLATPTGVAAAVPPQAAVPGGQVTVRDVLTEEALVPVPQATLQPEPGPSPAPRQGRTPAARLYRYYGAVAFSPKGRPGPPQPQLAAVALSTLPAAPGGLTADYTETAVTLTWDAVEATKPAPVDGPGDSLSEYDEAEMPVAVTYNLYRVVAGETPEAPAAGVAVPVPVNPSPVPLARASDRPRFGTEVCYQVRAVSGAGPAAVESEPSAPYCLTAVDRFAPAAPRSLAAVGSEGAVSLIWEPNDEADLAGYLILRGNPGDVTLQTLTPDPVAEPRFRDATAKPGMKYVYAVVAVDGRQPAPNVSPESNRVEEGPR